MKNTTNTSNGSTTKWKEKLIKMLENQIFVDAKAADFYKVHKINKTQIGIHLAIFTEPFLSLLLKGEKSIESRFSINKVPPFEKVSEGDIVFVKKSGGEVIGYFIAGKASYYSAPNEAKLEHIKKNFSKAIGTHCVNGFWESRHHAKHISLIEVKFITKLKPLKIDKRDRTAWSIVRLNPNLNQNEL